CCSSPEVHEQAELQRLPVVRVLHARFRIAPLQRREVRGERHLQRVCQQRERAHGGAAEGVLHVLDFGEGESGSGSGGGGGRRWGSSCMMRQTRGQRRFWLFATLLLLLLRLLPLPRRYSFPRVHLRTSI